MKSLLMERAFFVDMSTPDEATKYRGRGGRALLKTRTGCCTYSSIAYL